MSCNQSTLSSLSCTTKLMILEIFYFLFFKQQQNISEGHFGGKHLKGRMLKGRIFADTSISYCKPCTQWHAHTVTCTQPPFAKVSLIVWLAWPSQFCKLLDRVCRPSSSQRPTRKAWNEGNMLSCLIWLAIQFLRVSKWTHWFALLKINSVISELSVYAICK